MSKNSSILVTFIVVGWNNKDLLSECFESIKKQTHKSCSVIYVDNGSSDESIDYVRRAFPKVTVLDTGENLGFAIGNNLGIKQAFEDTQCKYVALLNSDARLAEDWAEKLIDFAEEHSNIASMQSSTYDYYDHSVLDSFGITVDHCGQAVQRGYRQDKARIDTQKVFGVNAAAALFTRGFLEAQPFGADYFDSDLWMYLEDVDLAARATVMGWDNWFVNTSAAYHMGSASSSKNPGFSVYMVYRNNLPVIIKNFPLSIVLRLLPGLLYTDLRSMYRLWRGKNYMAMKSIVRGRLYCIRMLPMFMRKHRLLKKYIATDSRLLWQMMNP